MNSKDKLYDQMLDVIMAWPGLRLTPGGRARLVNELVRIANDHPASEPASPIAKPGTEALYKALLEKFAIGGYRGTVTGTRWYTLLQQEKLAREIADHVEQAVAAECQPKPHTATTDARRAAELIGLLATSMASFIAEIDKSSSDVARYIAQRLAPIATLSGMFPTLDAMVKDGRKLGPPLIADDAFCAWCSVPKAKHNFQRHPFQLKTAPQAQPAATTASGRCHRVFKHSARIGDAMIPDGARCTKLADGHEPSQCAFDVKTQLEATFPIVDSKARRADPILAVDPGQQSAGILILQAIARADRLPTHVIQRDTYEMPREHANPPLGFLPCTRPAPHPGPCAHPPDVNYRWVGESLPDPEPLPPPPRVNLFSTAEARQRALMTAVSRAVHEYKFETGETIVPMIERVLDVLEDKTAGFLIASDLTGEPQPTEVDIDCKDARDRMNRVIRVRGLGVEIRFPPTYGDLWHAANLGEKMAERAHRAKLPPITPIAVTRGEPNTGVVLEDTPAPSKASWPERCRGGCSRGGEGPACGKLGCCG